MPSIAQRSFAGGEIAPDLYGRADQAKFANGARQIRNFIVQRFGGVTNRPGSKLVRETVGSSAGKDTRLRRFVYNNAQTYLLEWGDFTLRLIQNGAGIAASPTAWSSLTAYGAGDQVGNGGVNYYCILGHTNQAPPNATYWYAMPADGTWEAPTPFLQADLRRMQFVQSADVMTLTHPSYAPYELRRYSATRWVLTPAVFAPTVAAPGGVGATPGGAGAIVFNYKVTAVLPETYEESLGSAIATCTGTTPSMTAPNVVSWSTVAGALEYNVYKDQNGVYGFIGTARGTSFKDINYLPSTTDTLATPATVFNAAGKYPATSAYLQQRQGFAGATDTPENIKLSRTGVFRDFSVSSPLRDDDAIGFSLNAEEVNEVRHLLNIGRPVVFTSGGVWRLDGDNDGVLRPTAINPNMVANSGANYLRPVTIGNTVIYVQARGTIIRELQLDLIKGMNGRDLTIYAPHLFDGYQIVAWAYQENPHSVLWVVRSDGLLLGLTYVQEHEVWAWFRCDTDGDFKDIETVPEGAEDAVYVAVERTIGGVPRRFVERFASRRVTDVSIDAFFVDCGGTYDGRNTTATTLTLSASTTWAYTAGITMTASAGIFSLGSVGRTYVLTCGGKRLRCAVTAYTSPTVVTVEPISDVPTTHQGVATATWALTATTIGNLSHLEGKSVAILADGSVIANGLDEPTYTVAGGTITLPGPAAVVHVGLPYIADLETLDWEDPNQETLIDKKKLVQGVTLLVQETRGGWAGCPKTPDDGTAEWLRKNMNEIKQRSTEGYGEPTAPKTGTFEINSAGTWSDKGRILVRQRDPLPMTVLAAIPRGKIGG